MIRRNIKAGEGKEGFPGARGFYDPEVWAKVTGRARYGIDLALPGMLQGKILRSPHPHALIRNVDLSRARNLPGVRAVLSGTGLGAKPYGIVFDDENPLALDRVRYIGDEVAAVAAVDEQTALEALQMISVEYEPLPAVFDPEEALLKGAVTLHDDFPGNIAWENRINRGEAEAAFKDADLVVEDTYALPSFHPGYIEPISCIAESEKFDGLTLHTALQSPHIVREILAGVLGLSISRVRVISPVMGGGFGGRVYGNLKLYLLAAFLSRAAGAPVKMQLTREEEFTVGRPMVAARIKMKMALKEDGTFLARQADIITDNGAYSAQAPWVSKTLSERNDSLYHIPSISTRVRLVYTNKVPTGQYRAYGNQLANFACESLIDRAAGKLGMDPLRLRLKNCIGPGDTSVHGLQIKSCALSRCLQDAADAIGWTERKKGRGYGISAAIHAGGSIVFNPDFRGASARARLELDGRVTIVTGEQDYGQGAHGAFALIAARALSRVPGEINIVSRDTILTPFSIGALGMRQTTIGGRAVQLAAEDLLARIRDCAAELAGEEVVPEGGAFRTSSGRLIEPVGIAAFYCAKTSGLALTGEGRYVPEKSDYDQSGYGNIAVTYSFAAHACEVEIDRETGALTVHRFVAVHDSGRIVNLLTARGQVYGGVAQGLGMACSEGYIFEEGRVANPTFSGYRIPTALDLPSIETLFIQTDDPEGPYGAKGLGEIVQVPTPAAVANAVANALGEPVNELPLTAEKISRLLHGWECAD